MSYFKKLLIIGVVLILTTVNSFALKAEYRFEDCNGDASTNNTQGTTLVGDLSGDAKIALNGGKIENGLMLSGDGAMSIEHDPNLDLIHNLTITFWVKPQENKRQALIVRGGNSGKAGSNAEYSLVLWEDGKFKYKHNHTADIFSKSTIPLNKWTHIAVVRNNSAKSIKIYVNGKLDASRIYTIDPSSSNTEKLLIGTGEYYSDTMNNFNGVLDEIKIYNIVLSDSNISKIYTIENGKKHYTGECSTHKAPTAVNDKADLPIDGTVIVDVLSNDEVYDDDRCELNSSSVKIVSEFKNSTMSDNNKTLTVADEGVWSVMSNGSIKFVSNSKFYDNPRDISYVVADSCGALSNSATVSLTRVAVAVPTPTPTMPLPTPAPTPVTPIVTPTPTTNTPTPTPTITPTPTPTSTTQENISIGDRVWYDINKNGIQDNGEDGVSGVIVVLYNDKGAVLERTTTNASGEYRFDHIKKGSYEIGFSNLPSGYIFTAPNRGSDDSKDSDASSSGRVSNIDIQETNLNYDAGIVKTRIVSQSNVTNQTLDADCDCDDYKSSIPTINRLGVLALLILVGLVGTLYLKEEEFNLNIK